MNSSEMVCRTCLKNCQTHFDIFNDTRNNVLLVDMLANCISLEIQKDDGFPISICNDCMEKLTLAFDFKIMVIESNTKLHQLCQREGIKMEGELCSKYIEDIPVNQEVVMKIEKTTVIDLSCKNKVIPRGNQRNKEEIDVEVKLEFESLEESCGFLDDFVGNISNQEDSFRTKECENVKQSVLVTDLCCKNKGTLYNQGSKETMYVIGKAISNDSVEVVVKTEQTAITDLSCENQSSRGNQTNKEEMDIEVELGFESLKKDDSVKTNSSSEDPPEIEECQEVKQTVPLSDLHSDKKGAFGNQDVTAKLEFQSLHKNGRVPNNSATASLSPEDSLKAVKRKKIKETAPAANPKRKQRDNNKKNAELLDNPDYKRIISSRLTKEQKTRETIFCIECNKTFSYYHYVKRHAYIHTGKVPYKCDKCEKRYAKAYMLKKHIRLHLQTRDFTCDACGKAFYQKHHLKEHMAQKHSDERPHKCNVCNRTYKNIGTLWNHSKIHVKNRDFLCEICGEDFTQMKKLTIHKKSHFSEENFICNMCGKTFDEKRALNSHLKEHRASVNPRTRKNKDTLGNRTSKETMDVKTRLEFKSLDKYADVSDDAAGTSIKIEETIITGLPCKNEDTVGNQENKEELSVKVKLESFESLEENDSFLSEC